MKYSENAINIMTALSFKGIGRAWIVKNFRSPFLDIEGIVDLINATTKKKEEISTEDFEGKKSQVLSLIYSNAEHIDGIVALGDKDFPQYRGYVKNSDQPVFLTYKGDVSLLHKRNRNIAVIGLLNPDPEIESIEKKIVSRLVRRHATIISGLALGCDTIAHEQTLESGGKTIAILPSPIRTILPSSNRVLADIIVSKGGLLVSEYLTDAKSKSMLSSRYQERDRLQALYSDGIILSASYAKNDKGYDCGSRLAMQYAKEYRIRRGMIYDESFAANPKFDLNRQYLMEDNNISVFNYSSNSSELNNWVKMNEVYSQPSLFEL